MLEPERISILSGFLFSARIKEYSLFFSYSFQRSLKFFYNISINFELTIKQKNERSNIMGWFTKEAKAFGKEFKRQGSLLLFGKPRRSKRRKHRTPSERYKNYKRWARNNGFD